MLALVCLDEHDVLALDLSSDDEWSDGIVSSTEHTVVINRQVELHFSLVAALLVETKPLFDGVHLEFKVSGETADSPSSADNSVVELSLVIDCMLSDILLDERDVTRR